LTKAIPSDIAPRQASLLACPDSLAYPSGLGQPTGWRPSPQVSGALTMALPWMTTRHH